MRQERIIQASIFDVFAGHEIGRELEAISRWLDEHRSVLSLVIGDLRMELAFTLSWNDAQSAQASRLHFLRNLRLLTSLSGANGVLMPSIAV
jgi:hypothetical protein